MTIMPSASRLCANAHRRVHVTRVAAAGEVVAVAIRVQIVVMMRRHARQGATAVIIMGLGPVTRTPPALWWAERR